MGAVTRLGVAAEALGALSALAEVRSAGDRLDPAVGAALADVAAALDVSVADLEPDQLVIVANAARTFLHLACDLRDEPGRAPGWSIQDPRVLLSIGRMSAFLADVIATVVPTLDTLAGALDRDGAAICDVGSGVGALSIALCRRFPRARVVGVDPWPPSVELAREEVGRSGMEDRIELRQLGIEDLLDRDVFDLTWFAGPFVPPPVLPAALHRVHDSLRPGGWLIFGLFAGPPDPVAASALRLRVVRAGGSVAGPEVAVALSDAGFVDVHHVPRSWAAPAEFLAARRSL